METGYLLLSDGRKIELPEGIPVLGRWDISDSAREELVEVFVPDSVVFIDDHCFQSAPKLQRVRFSMGDASILRMIGWSAFDGCNELREINFPGCLRYIGDCAFAQTALTAVDLSETQISYIGAAAFVDCAKLMKVKLGSSLKMVPDGCFAHCRQLMKVSFGSYTSIIDRNAFESCDDLSIVDGVYLENVHIVQEGNKAFLAALND